MRTNAIIIIIALTLFSVAGHRVAAAEHPEVIAPIHQFVDGFNKGDTKSALAACEDPICIIDDFPPHEWHGPGASQKWMSDYDVDAKKNGISDGLVKLYKPKHVDVTDDRAYVVVPADYTYKQNGKQVKQHKSLLTAALHKTDKGWLITGWSWSKN